MEEAGRDLLFRLLQNIDQLPSLLGIASGEEAIGSACLLGTSCPSDTMNVVLSVVGEIKVHYKLYIMDIYMEGRKTESQNMLDYCVRKSVG